MDPITDQISRISEKLTRLVRDFRGLQKENVRLRHELDRKTQYLEQALEKNAVLERQAGILQASASMSTDKTGKEMGKVIEHYIREIDRCIAKLEE